MRTPARASPTPRPRRRNGLRLLKTIIIVRRSFISGRLREVSVPGRSGFATYRFLFAIANEPRATNNETGLKKRAFNETYYTNGFRRPGHRPTHFPLFRPPSSPLHLSVGPNERKLRNSGSPDRRDSYRKTCSGVVFSGGETYGSSQRRNEPPAPASLVRNDTFSFYTI